MKRSSLIVALCVLVAGGMAAPALAAVDKNPNATELVGVSCPDAGLFFDSIWVATAASLAGHDPDSNIVGVAKSLFVTDPDGNPLFELFHRPGKGLGNITVWCFWPDGASPTGFLGGDVLFRAHLRP